MAPESVVARLRYLDCAAHLLSVESPAVSAQLLSQYNKTASENELNPSDARRRSVCGACGNIMVPGWTCHVRSRRSGRKKVLKRRSSRPQKTGPSSVPGANGIEMNELEMVYECRVCGRATRQTLPKTPPPRRPARNTMPIAGPSTPATHLGVDAIEPPKPATANASSKKRAKARKQGGLQALLAKRKEVAEQTGDFGLDLMDLMKKAEWEFAVAKTTVYRVKLTRPRWEQQNVQSRPEEPLALGETRGVVDEAHHAPPTSAKNKIKSKQRINAKLHRTAPYATAAMSPAATPASRPDLFEDVGKKVEKLSLDQDGATGSSNPGEADLGVGADGDGQRMVDEIESLCMNCQEDGTTRLLLTRIPYFKEIILMSFYCPHCHFRNNDIQSAGQIQQRGCKYVFEIPDMEGLSRQIIRSDTAVVKIKELDLEIPPGRGQLTNIEGLLRGIVDGLTQQARAVGQPELRSILDSVRLKGEQMLNGAAFPFTLEIDDPTGNSFIQPSASPEVDGKYVRTDYDRTPQQNEELSLTDTTGDAEDVKIPSRAAKDKSFAVDDDEILPGEVYSFPASCPGCTRPCATNMKMVEIPHFKSVIIMSTICESCGYRSNEIKTGGEVPDKGRRITLAVVDAEDLSRDVLKSESCHLSSPELMLSVQPGTLGGRFTTVEGLLTHIRDDLHSNIYDMDGRPHAYIPGDSLDEGTKSKWELFFTNLDLAIKAEKKFTIILEDPLAASYVQSLTAPDPDPQITIENYDRTDEEEEDLGLKDMKVEGYEGDPQGEERK